MRTSFTALLSEIHFVSTPVPGSSNLFTALSQGIDLIKGVQISAPVVQRAAISDCETSKGVCNSVDDLTRRSSILCRPIYGGSVVNDYPTPFSSV